MENFTPVASTLGGILIGLSAAMLMLFHGRIAGITGILAGTVRGVAGDLRWRAWFLGGMVLGGLCLGFANPSFFAMEITRSPVAMLTAGLLVGFGTRLGSGCTSGHGVCGISRFSRRSILATITFIATGVVMATVVTQLLGGTV
ncbi:MAG: YeeE/YedE family protein [Deltaproteobacteria bacterium]|nr:YeeE/YedE family protein [Deltaproteobacteria bacterium]